jgi:hypothetical protein
MTAGMTQEDFTNVTALLRLCPIRFCLFLKALVGVEDMQDNDLGYWGGEPGVIAGLVFFEPEHEKRVRMLY